MAIKTISIKDAFKDKVTNTTFREPTIWVDWNGIEHEDYEYPNVYTEGWGKSMPKNACTTNDQWNDSRRKYITVFGIIKQIGSHVTTCGRLVSEYKEPKEYPFDLSETFRYAVNLRHLANTFKGCKYLKEIPENIFWNCPNLERIDYTFADTDITSIPENLFVRNQKLNEIWYGFYQCFNLKELPDNLFKNNPNLRNIGFAFAYTKNFPKIPEKVLAPILDKINNKEIKVTGCFQFSEVAEKYKNLSFHERGLDPDKCNPEVVQQLKNEGLIPDSMPDEVFVDMIADQDTIDF